VRLVVEPYGGSIFSTWTDRPLSVAGRIILEKDGNFLAKTVKIDRDLVLIPNLAIHMNRDVNTGYKWNAAVDMLPLFSQNNQGNATLKSILAQELNCEVEDIRGFDLFLYNRQKGSVWGANEEFFSSPRIDNLMCLYGTLEGLLAAKPLHAINLLLSADNEETGSATKQGAGSVFLSDTLSRICESLNADKRQMLASSMMISADNGHAKHPNHPEMSDAKNAPHLNGGVVIKSNAAQKYTTDGISCALFESICKSAGVPVQYYANRSDLPGGSTLGSISNTQVPLITVDIGMAQLAMHSSYETADAADTVAMVNALTAFFGKSLKMESDGTYRLK
jgi:aspartyl aminopeptidase